MNNTFTIFAILDSFNRLAGGLFLLASFGIVVTRQVKTSLILFITQSFLLSASAFILSFRYGSDYLYALAFINLLTKPVLIPWILEHTVPEEIYIRRETEQVLSITTSLFIILLLTIIAYFLSIPIEHAANIGFHVPNISIGLAVFFLGAYTLTIRQEAIPLLIGLLTMENGVFFAGIFLVHSMPLLIESAIAMDVLILTFIIGILTRAVHHHIGTTKVGALKLLKEQLHGEILQEELQ